MAPSYVISDSSTLTKHHLVDQKQYRYRCTATWTAVSKKTRCTSTRRYSDISLFLAYTVRYNTRTSSVPEHGCIISTTSLQLLNIPVLPYCASTMRSVRRKSPNISACLDGSTEHIQWQVHKEFYDFSRSQHTDGTEDVDTKQYSYRFDVYFIADVGLRVTWPDIHTNSPLALRRKLCLSVALPIHQQHVIAFSSSRKEGYARYSRRRWSRLQLLLV